MGLFDIFRKKTASFSDLELNSDWHCHVLAGVDDGVKFIEESISILKSMKESGITNVVLTPHLNPEIFPDNTESSLKERYDLFMESLPDDVKNGLNIRLAAEYMVCVGFEDRNPSELLQIANDKVLIEMSYYFPSQNMEESIFNITSAGLVPVIAHPERYLYYAGDLSVFERYHDMGAEFQCNLLSLKGVYGPASIKILEHIMRKGWYTYIGSDTHTLNHFSSIRRMEFNREYPKYFENVKR